jgi:hypothetical protein
LCGDKLLGINDLAANGHFIIGLDTLFLSSFLQIFCKVLMGGDNNL